MDSEDFELISKNPNRRIKDIHQMFIPSIKVNELVLDDFKSSKKADNYNFAKIDRIKARKEKFLKSQDKFILPEISPKI